MPDAGEVRLRRKREEPRPRRAAPPSMPSSCVAIDAKLGNRERRVVHRRAFARANSRIPFTELWLSAVSSSCVPWLNGYDFAHVLQRAGRIGGEDGRVSSGGALNHSSTARRVCSTSVVIRCDEGLAECGLPKTCSFSSFACSSTWDSACRPAPV